MQGPTYAERSYVVHGEFATGGMATVHYGRAIGASGFGRTVAVKKLHSHFAKDPRFLAMFMDEARLAIRIQHSNVVGIVDVVARDDEVFIVMDYVHGEPLSSLLGRARKNGDAVDAAIAASVICGALHGLHAAHEAKSETGAPLHIVHRDVSPQNLLVGIDGATRVLDFGVARAVGQRDRTREGELKGKLSYMAPEQIEGEALDRRCDVYSAGVVLWEMLTGRRLFAGDNEGNIIARVLRNDIAVPSTVNPAISAELDRIVMTAVAMDPAQRFSTARGMAIAIESLGTSAGAVSVGEWVQDLAGETLATRAAVVARIESGAPEDAASTDEPSAPRRILRADEDTLRTAMRFSSESLHDPARRPSRPKWHLGIAIFAAVVLLGTVGVASHRMGASHSTSAAVDPMPTTSTPSLDPSASASAQQTAMEESGGAAGAIAPPAIPAPPAPSATSPATRNLAHLPRVGATIASSARSPSSAAHVGRAPSSGTSQPANCNPPYTVVGGVKLPKPECPLD